MNKLTKDDILDWMLEKGEDPIQDGPLRLHEDEQIELMKTIDTEIADATDFSFLWITFPEKKMDYIANKYADFLNKKGYQDKFRKNWDNY